MCLLLPAGTGKKFKIPNKGRVIHPSSNGNEQCWCTKEVDRVCGENPVSGQRNTYLNPCKAHCDGNTVLHYGDCVTVKLGEFYF